MAKGGGQGRHGQAWEDIGRHRKTKGDIGGLYIYEYIYINIEADFQALQLM